ncbi:hypothetical protein BC835DRAFT_948547 [Cytidiella melzeri]|nr:hypothetical protein BC835DRAFT_948547 [Cytidiella melzeri]
MIRRDPTLIPMTDNDVQDVRDAVKARKAEAATRSSAAKSGASVPGFLAQMQAQKKKEGMTKNERLGLA